MNFRTKPNTKRARAFQAAIAPVPAAPGAVRAWMGEPALARVNGRGAGCFGDMQDSIRALDPFQRAKR